MANYTHLETARKAEKQHRFGESSCNYERRAKSAMVRARIMQATAGKAQR